MNLLHSKTYKVELLFELTVKADINMEASDIVNEIKNQLIIKKSHEGWNIDDIALTYGVYKTAGSEMVEV